MVCFACQLLFSSCTKWVQVIRSCTRLGALPWLTKGFRHEVLHLWGGSLGWSRPGVSSAEQLKNSKHGFWPMKKSLRWYMLASMSSHFSFFFFIFSVKKPSLVGPHLGQLSRCDPRPAPPLPRLELSQRHEGRGSSGEDVRPGMKMVESKNWLLLCQVFFFWLYLYI